MNRRDLFALALALTPAFMLTGKPSGATVREQSAERLSQLERRHGGRLGVSILDLDVGAQIAHRADERFLMCSTFKLLAVAAVLARIDRGDESLSRRLMVERDALLAWAPVTRNHVGAPGMSVAALCEAAITVSDNTAANLLLKELGGPPAVTAFIRTLGDEVTRLDRIEPELNNGAPGDLRDTTTPNAMLTSVRALLVGNALSDRSRAQLIAWLRACTTGADKLRSAVPAAWPSGDKTGSGSHGESNDVAIIWPPARKPLLIAAYYAPADRTHANPAAVLAEVGRVAVALAMQPKRADERISESAM